MGATVGAAVLDARWACAAQAQPPSLWATWLATAGVLAPLGLALGAVVGLGALVLGPEGPPSWTALRRSLTPPSTGGRAELAVVTFTAPLAVAVWLTVTGEAALGVLASSLGSRAAGVAGALALVGWALGLGLCVLGLGRRLGPRLVGWRLDPLTTGVLGVGVAGAVLALGVGAGDVGGGSGPLLMYGVLRREELDLRAPALLALVAAGAYLAPALLARLPAWGTAPVALVPLLLTAHAAHGGLSERRTALALETGAPTARLLLGPLRRLGDRDRDGASSLFGGGDCDDHDARRHPGADDLPANGLDEDCSGADALRVELAVKPPPVAADAATELRRRIPKDLSIVILSIDALRWDTPGFMGNPRRVTPHLDALAARAVVFEAAYAPASYTGKSLPVMMVGKYGSELHRGWAHFNRIDERDTLVWQRLQAAGYKTLGAQGYWYFFRKGIGFERGYDVLDGSAAPGLGYTEKDESVTSEKIADRTLEILADRANTGGRFFFWTHYVDPHADYIAHEGFEFGATAKDRYEGEVAYTDYHVGRVLDYIAKSDLAQRTAIVITSDHGEAFGEHGMIRHGFEIWEPLVRVPLFVYVPGLSPHRVKQRRGLIDLVPTLLDLAGVKPPTGTGDDFVSGQSLVPELVKLPGHVPDDRIVFVDMQAGPNNEEKQAFIEGDVKLIATNGRPTGLYDLARDPGEAEDLLDSDPARREAIVARYQAFRRQLRTVRVDPVPR